LIQLCRKLDVKVTHYNLCKQQRNSGEGAGWKKLLGLLEVSSSLVATTANYYPGIDDREMKEPLPIYHQSETQNINSTEDSRDPKAHHR
jgi:hypothetical protein